MPIANHPPSPEPIPAPPPEWDYEELRFHAWRRKQFRALEFSRVQTQCLDLAGADWHEAERLISRGCARDIAVEILT